MAGLGPNGSAIVQRQSNDCRLESSDAGWIETTFRLPGAHGRPGVFFFSTGLRP